MSSSLLETVGCVRSLDCFKYLGSAATVRRKRNQNFSEGNKQYFFGSYMRGMIKSQTMTKYQLKCGQCRQFALGIPKWYN